MTPDFLEQVIAQVRASGFEIVSLDEAQFRMIEGDHGKPFVCFTFDDGYRDNLEYAYPIFKRHNLPFAIYVPTDYADGDGDLWWLALEKVIVKVDALSVKLDGVHAAAALRHAGREGCRLPGRLLVAADHRRGRRARLRARPVQRCRLRSRQPLRRFAKKEFTKFSGEIEKIKDEKLKAQATELQALMNKRYGSHDQLFEAYSNGLNEDRKIYEMIKDEDLMLEDLELQIETTNAIYESVFEANTQFNQLTEEFNDAKIKFYEEFGINIEKSK